MLMLSKRYKSTDVDRINWLHMTSGTHRSTSSASLESCEVVSLYDGQALKGLTNQAIIL